MLDYYKNRYLKHSWVDPRIEVRTSAVEGKGLFAKEVIKKGEVIEIFGGEIFTVEEEAQGKMRIHTGINVDDGLYLGLPVDSIEESIDEFTNHSCDPSCWLVDEVTLVTRRDINSGEEITMDYGTWYVEEGDIWITNCACRTKLCRHTVTGDDWKRKDLQQRYKGHFSPFIERMIAKLEG